MAQQVTWRKSSYSSGEEGSDCVEVAVAPSGVGVRDSKAATAGELVFASSAWRAFLASTS
jgi:hypothetical protein